MSDHPDLLRGSSLDILGAGPMEATRQKVEEDLVEAMQKILRSNVTIHALENPARMTLDDIVLNLYLYERLGIAFAAVGALRGYTNKPRGYKIFEGETG